MEGFQWPKDVATWVSVIALVAQAVNLFMQKQYEAGIAALTAALGLLGVGSTVTRAAAYAKAAEKQASFAATDTMTMRNDPSMPGPPLSVTEIKERVKETP